MKLKALSITLLFVFTSFYTQAQSDYSVSSIPEGLTKRANAVIRLSEVDIQIGSTSRMTVTERRVVTVLNEKGSNALKAYIHYDPNVRIKKLEAVVLNASGKEIKKLRKNDFLDESAISGGTLYSDSRIKHLEYTPSEYPYTIDFICVADMINTAFLPSWRPLDRYMTSTEKSTYNLEHPEELKHRIKEKNFEGYDIISKKTDNSLYYEINNVNARKREELSPAYYETEPMLFVGLNNFHLEGVDGTASDWESFGKWQYDKLLTDRDVLPQETVSKVSQLVEGIDDPIKKAKKIYEYVQDNTRYISVQLGIGGWMPIDAQEVDKVKYGDCKGLTNYTKALLKSQGIDAYYSVVWAGSNKRSMESDFASMQGNHVILNIPNGEDDIWLECTSQVLPFGFLGDFTDDRDVLVITPEGGKIKHTRAYLDDENKMVTKASYTLKEDGAIEGEVKIITEGIQYDDRYTGLSRYSEDEREEFYKRYWGNINNVKISDLQLLNNKEAVQFYESVKVKASSYAISTQDGDILLQVNPFNVNNGVPSRYRNRKQLFEVSRGYLDEDEYKVTLPASYMVELLPNPIRIQNKFGTYEVEIQRLEDNKLLYKRKLAVKKGRYPSEDYNAYRNFRREVAKGDNLKLVLTPKKE
ncbi:DUF3857 domain-containing protein [Leptobacterium flavescens]|uniref:DUF3857 domain-containing protein n=1 Tax=Leptobacterium flavescens TaxID=472055 RepID=A0A6P0UGX3_9FLAO|nr:DUF3857 domain-containing protein [Leptobacterium flavescens]NER12505.1 DUF3857 domain-containing protein [Leptobacterium flavescens]